MVKHPNHLPPCGPMRNRYFALRHGRSEANRAGLIVSHPANGVPAYGLTDTGRTQVRQSVESARHLGPTIRIVSSDFRRARETAELAHDLLCCRLPVIFDERLRERNFGRFELGTDERYADVWQADARDSDARPGDTESANQVMDRVTRLVSELDASSSNECFLLVSHGDALQILQTAFVHQDASQHRSVAHLDTAEIRELTLPGVA